MYSESPRESEFRPPRESFGDLLSRLTAESAGLIRDEIELAKEEMREKVHSLRKGMIAIVISIVLGILALGTLDVALVLALGKLISLETSAVVVGMVILIVAGILAGWGIAQIRRTSLKPDATIRSLQEDREWLRRMVGIH